MEGMKEAVVEAFTDLATKKDIRKIDMAISVKTIFRAEYLFVKVIKISHPGDAFTPDGDTFTNDESDFELVSGPSHNMSDKAFNISTTGSKIVIFTNQKKCPEGSVYVKNIAELKENLSDTVKKYNNFFSGKYDAAAGIDEKAGEEVL